MNYRHAFHAGNFADVVKHATLALALERMTQKPKPLRVVDTHAGIGTYRLDGPEAQRTGEWRSGIGRLLGPDALPLPPAAEALLAPYLEAIRAANPKGGLAAYPGSPSLALALLRADDRLIASELHPDDADLLRLELRGDRRAKVLALDGWQTIRAVLPPKERRGLILIDPPFEEPGELDRLITGLGDGLRRFATGTYMLWLPVKDPSSVAAFRNSLRELGLQKTLWLELRVAPVATIGPLTATALVLVNPPFGLEDDLKVLLPFLADRLAIVAGGGAWEAGPV
ncbi:MAG: 23S rRNA (adenine(2030)-N(6))-methyltransferase RlmJ [Hyphomicrobiaceae bacterium]